MSEQQMCGYTQPPARRMNRAARKAAERRQANGGEGSEAPPRGRPVGNGSRSRQSNAGKERARKARAKNNN